MRYFLTYYESVCLKTKKILNGKVKFWTDLKYFEISIFRCSFADLKNDAIRELSHQIIIFASFVHHCDFRFVRKQFFEEKIEKKIIEDKRLQSLFLCERKIATNLLYIKICHLRV
jgi:hypothetical protein